MTNGVFEAGERVITKHSEGVVNKSQEKKEDHIKVKLDIGEVKNYLQAEISDDLMPDKLENERRYFYHDKRLQAFNFIVFFAVGFRSRMLAG